MNTKLTKKSISGKGNQTESKRVFVGLSGGVDSAVSAALLKDAGYNVTGVFIKVWSPEFLPCSWREERRDAMRVAVHLDIPFLFFDFSVQYKRGVVDYMISEYKLGHTPNPDVMCNREIKFGAFWNKAREHGADFIATGHYARLSDNILKEGKDKEKDQSYFLWTLTQNDLGHALFPVGDLEKKEVRQLAKKYRLPVASKKDSQGICFIGDVPMEEFLKEFFVSLPGQVIDTKGEKIGVHKGAIHYTLGQRHGFEILQKEPDDLPYYVISKDIGSNTITVSNEKKVIREHSAKKISIRELNWIGESKQSTQARIRYRQKKFEVVVNGNVVTFSQPQVAVPGQSIVFYDDEICLGGGIIDEVLI